MRWFDKQAMLKSLICVGLIVKVVSMFYESIFMSQLL